MPVSKEELQRAIKAFKKRLKLYRRDDESQGIVSKLSGGRSSGIVGIALPDGFAPEVWQELEAKGRIRKVPGSAAIYEIVEQQQQ
jgi:hypothetical protein